MTTKAQVALVLTLNTIEVLASWRTLVTKINEGCGGGLNAVLAYKMVSHVLYK